MKFSFIGNYELICNAFVYKIFTYFQWINLLFIEFLSIFIFLFCYLSATILIF
jgi:hypothetical protein